MSPLDVKGHHPNGRFLVSTRQTSSKFEDPRGAGGSGEEEQNLNGSTRGSGVRIMFRSTLIRVRALDSCNLSLLIEGNRPFSQVTYF